MDKVLEQVVILILMIAAGFIAAKTGIIKTEGRDTLTKLVLNVASPMLVINSFQIQFSAETLKNMGIIALFAAVSMFAFYLLGSKLWLRQQDGRHRVLWQALIFSNCGFMGYPVLNSLIGSVGIMYGSVFVMVFIVFSWTVGVSIFAGKTGGWKEILLQPGLISVAVGLLLFAFSIKLPHWLGQTVANLGSLNTPLAMLLVGALVADGDFRAAFKDRTVFSASAVRLVVLPVLALGAVWLLSLVIPGMPSVGSPVMLSCIMLTAMPVAANVAIFASMYDKKPQFAAQIVLVSTLLSVGTIPLWMLVLQAFK